MYFDERENELNYSNENNEVNSYSTTYNDVDSKKFDNDYKINIDNISINNFRAKREEGLFTAKEGLNKGNMFKNLYNPYKNYIYKVVVKGEKDELLLRIQELTFKVIDLNLYLDLYPNDEYFYKEFRDSVGELKRLKDLYEKNYGPLCLEETLYYDSYKWSKNPWPWMNEGGNN